MRITCKKKNNTYRTKKKQLGGSTTSTASGSGSGKATINITGLLEERHTDPAIANKIAEITSSFQDLFKKHIEYFKLQYRPAQFDNSDLGKLLESGKIAEYIPRMYSEIDTIAANTDNNYYYLNMHGSNKIEEDIIVPDKMIICFFTPKHHSVITSTNLLDYFEDIYKSQNLAKINNIKNRRILITENSFGSQNSKGEANNYGCFENSTWYYPGQKINNMRMRFSMEDYKKAKNRFRFCFNFQNRSNKLTKFEIKKHFFFEQGFLTSHTEGQNEFLLEDYLGYVDEINKVSFAKSSIVFIKACALCTVDNYLKQMRDECLLFNFNLALERYFIETISKPAPEPMIDEITCSINRFSKNYLTKDIATSPSMTHHSYSRKIPILQKIEKRLTQGLGIDFIDEGDINYLIQLSPQKLRLFFFRLKHLRVLGEFDEYDELAELIFKNPLLSRKVNLLKEQFIKKFHSNQASLPMFSQEFQGYLDVGLPEYIPNILNFSRNFLIDNTTTADKISALGNLSEGFTNLTFSNIDIDNPKIFDIVTSNQDKIRTFNLTCGIRSEDFARKIPVLPALYNLKLCLDTYSDFSFLNRYHKLKLLYLENLDSENLEIPIPLDFLQISNSSLKNLRIKGITITKISLINIKNVKNITIESFLLKELKLIDIPKIILDVKQNTSLQTLELVNVFPSHLANFKKILKYPRLTEFKLTHTEITNSEDLSDIINVLTQKNNLTSLNFEKSTCKDTKYGFDINEFLKNSNNLEFLHLGNLTLSKDLDPEQSKKFKLSKNLKFDYKNLSTYPNLEAYMETNNYLLV